MTNTTNRAKPTAARWTVAVLSIGGAAVIAACGYGGTGSSGMQPSSGTPTSGGGSVSTIPCSQITALRTSLTNLSHTSVNIASASQLTADLAQIEQEMATLQSESRGAFSSQVSQLSAGLDQIKTDAGALAKDPSPTNLTNLTNAVKNFKASSQLLVAQLQTICP
jgi:hypothetical protein